LRKIKASDSCPAAHNGLVGGSSPTGPTTQSDANRNLPVSDAAAIPARRALARSHEVESVWGASGRDARRTPQSCVTVRSPLKAIRTGSQHARKRHCSRRP
jgi:hypothetical protein